MTAFVTLGSAAEFAHGENSVQGLSLVIKEAQILR